MSDLQVAKRAFEIAKKNLEFVRLSPSAKRVAIAQDVIAQIRAKTIIAETGVYIESPAMVDNKIASCTACALGSVFVAASCKIPSLLNDEGVLNDLDHGEYSDDGDMREKLAPYFSKDQLLLMEAAFESNPSAWNHEHEEDDWVEGSTWDEKAGTSCDWTPESEFVKHPVSKAIVNFQKIEDNDKRLVAIMKNIVTHKGTFKP